MIAESVARIALNGSPILQIRPLPVAIEVKADIGQRGVSFSQVRIEFNCFERRPAGRRHGLRGGHNFIEREKGEGISKAGVRQGEMRIFLDRCFETLHGLAQAFLVSLFPKVPALQVRFAGAGLFDAPGEATRRRRRNDLQPDA